jgi:hypothetical protein
MAPVRRRVCRPIVGAEVLAADGSWVFVRFLLDSGADDAVFSSDVTDVLQLLSANLPFHISRVGGRAGTTFVETEIRLTQDQGIKPVFRGQFATVADPDALHMSVLGRDILNLFSVVIIDRPGDRICLLRERHRYTIEQI